YYAYDRVSAELASAKPVAVPDVEGLRQSKAVEQIIDAGLVPAVRRVTHDTVEEGLVIEQDPKAGERIDKGNAVTLIVSQGKRKTPVPEVRGKSRDDAVQAIADAGLKARVVEVNSDKEEGTVTAQEPRAGESVEEGAVVRINVSKGPKQVEVPNVVGLPYDSAVTVLGAAGFDVSKNEVSSNDAAAGFVVGQDPDGRVPAPKGSTVTLQVSTGPSSSAVPDVSNLDETSASETLESAGFKVRVKTEDTTDPALDGVVVSQDPPAGTVVEPGSRVTIFVGRFLSGSTGPPVETTP
ncbi:MAG: PASTA domain-containing protein, partial [Actinobacteria bacterium]|nr:PASTA domain-containing protein [Actinomycetota bacterium]